VDGKLGLKFEPIVVELDASETVCYIAKDFYEWLIVGKI
jgi:hypothetical protein